MNVLPRRLQDQLEWFDQHAPVWVDAATGPTNIGITPAQAAAFSDAAADARKMYEEQLAAIEAARVATARMRAAVQRAFEMASVLVANVKATAGATKDSQVVFNAAQVPAPRGARPGTMDAPGKPVVRSVELEPTTGAMTIRWSARQPRNAKGTVYVVRRRVGIGAMEFVGVTGEKSLRDVPPIPLSAPIPPNATSPSSMQSDNAPITIEYTVQAQRGASVGAVSDVFTINVGTSAPRASREVVETSAASAVTHDTRRTLRIPRTA